MTADVRRQAMSEAVRIEMRRQIDLGVRSGINPSHVDNHMIFAMCDEFLEISLQAGREREIPSFMARDLGNSPRRGSGSDGEAPSGRTGANRSSITAGS